MVADLPFRGARLLVLGAGPYQIPVIRRALDLGCDVITVDNVPTNPGHALATASEIVSTVDLDGVLAVARRHAVNGVLTYGSDVSVPAVAFVAEELRLPGNPLASAALLQRKDRIRDLQRELELPHPRYVAASSADDLMERARAADLPFPLIVKPADSSGSKGQSVAESVDGLATAFHSAAPFSRCGVVVAEELLPDDMTEVVCEAMIVDGQLVFAHYGHNWFCDSRHPRVPAGEVVPGPFSEELTAEIDRQIQTLVTGAGVRTGCMNFDALVSRGRFVLLDVGLRSGGNFVPEIVWRSTGVDLTTASIELALGGKPSVPQRHVQPARSVVSEVVHVHTRGAFDRIEVPPDLQSLLVRVESFAMKGERVNPYTRGDAGVGVAIFELPDVASAMRLITERKHLCSVTLTS